MANNITLETLNSVNFQVNKPSFILITIFLPFGVIGNILSLFIFFWHETKSNLRIFMIFLTLIDLLCCILGVPFAMVDLLLPVMFPSGTLCKMKEFLLYFCHIACPCTLLTIAIERYNTICRSSRRQLNLFQTKKITLAIVGVSLLLALPMSLVADRFRFQLTDDIYGHVCNYELPVRWDIYEWTLSALFFIVFIAIFTLHGFVWKSLSRSEVQDMEAEQIDEVENVEQNRNKQINRTQLGISILYLLSLLPYMVLNIVGNEESSVSRRWLAFELFLSNLWIINCTGKTVVYALFDIRFREHLKNFFRWDKKSNDNEDETIKETES